MPGNMSVCCPSRTNFVKSMPEIFARHGQSRFVKPCLKNLSVTEGRRKSKDVYDLFLLIIVGAFPVSEAIPVSDFLTHGSPLVSPKCLTQQENFSMSIAKEC